ncbi:MAG: prepilin-type N-terminal cleavage/methylation domain-containing protein [bacterium]|nr:prepilin-type N-terminal cleavage/methylation domain-containing protein [bacterium]
MNCKPVSEMTCTFRISNSKGLTLTEVLIALAITAIIASAIYITFRTILGGYNKGKAQVTMAETARAALSRLTDDLRHTSVSTSQLFLVSNDSTSGKKGDGIDNDNDGRTDEEIRDGIDNDGDYNAGTDDLDGDGADLDDFHIDEDCTYDKDTIDFYTISGSHLVYYVDTSSRLMRKKDTTEDPVAFSVKEFNVLCWDTTTTVWHQSWNSGTTATKPKSVYIALTIEDESGQIIPHTYTTMVTLP